MGVAGARPRVCVPRPGRGAVACSVAWPSAWTPRRALALPLYADGGSLAAAALAIIIPPVSILIIGFLAWLWIGGRRRAGEKYAGLRSLTK